MKHQATTAFEDATETLDALLTVWRRITPPGSTLSRTAAGTLATLYRFGPVRLTTLAEHEAVSQPAMTGLVQRLQDAKLTTRTTDPSDGRAVLIALTDMGRSLVETRKRHYADRIEAMLASLDPGDFDRLVDALPALRQLNASVQTTQENA